MLAGAHIALSYRWGIYWYTYVATPWFWSLARFQPAFDTMTGLPWIVKFHAVNGFVVIGLIPFTRLAHMFAVPLDYLWRPFQVVIWNRGKAR